MRQFTGAAATDRSVASTAHRREKGSQWEALTIKNYTRKDRGGGGSPDRRMLIEKGVEVKLKSNRKDLPQLPRQASSCQALHGTGMPEIRNSGLLILGST